MSAAEINWAPVKQAVLGHDPGLQLYGEISEWFHKVRLFRKGEEQYFHQLHPTAEDMEIHKRLLQRLIADGEHLVRVTEQAGGLIENAERIKTVDLEATVDSLRDTFRGWHEPMPAEQRDKILNEVFARVS